MLLNEGWVTWANENVVLVVGHDGATGENKQHEPTKETDPKTKESKDVCPLYTGLTCDEHKAIVHEVSSTKDGFGKIDVPSGFPNSWMIGPDGTVEKIENKDAAIPKNLEDALVAFQKKYDAKPIPAKTWEKLKKSIADGDAAAEAGKWKDALAAYLKVDSDGLAKKQKHLIDKIKAKTDAVNEKAAAKLAEIKDGSEAAADKVKALKALRDQVAAKFSFGNLAVLADLDALAKDLAASAAPAH